MKQSRKEHYKRRMTRIRNYNTELVRSLKEQRCPDCGIEYPHYVMDFDHVVGSKVTNIGKMMLHKGTNRLIDEIVKCEVVCSNCHRIREWKRRNT